MGWICRLRWPGGGPEQVAEDMAWHGRSSHPPTGHAPDLARQVIKGELEDLEPPAEA